VRELGRLLNRSLEQLLVELNNDFKKLRNYAKGQKEKYPSQVPRRAQEREQLCSPREGW
jgi:hypothetical protein